MLRSRQRGSVGVMFLIAVALVLISGFLLLAKMSRVPPLFTGRTTIMSASPTGGCTPSALSALASSADVKAQAVKTLGALGISVSPRGLLDTLEVTSVPSTSIVQIEV